MTFNIEGVIHSMYDIPDQLADYLRRIAEICFSHETDEKEQVFQDLKLFEKRREGIRTLFIKTIGGLDLEKTPLNICRGETLQRGNYEIRKLIFESQPGFHVTCNLYVPSGIVSGNIKKAPGILFTCGHNIHAKAGVTYQKACIDLVNNGMVVLAMDCISQGERLQYIDQKTGRKFLSSNGGTIEHSYAGLQFSLAGANIAQVFVWDMIRALDVLCDLDFVDSSRIGVTGNSGGGTQSSYLMMADPRLAAAAPCCYINSREEWMKTGFCHDNEQNQFGFIESGLNYDDFLLAFAPKPLLIGSTSADFFCIEAVEKSFARGQKAYTLYNKKDSIELVTVAGLHGLNDDLRTAVVNFFRRIFLGLPGDFKTDVNMTVEEVDTLWCTEHGQVLRAFPTETTVTDLARKHVNAVKRNITASNMAQVISEFFKFPDASEKIAIRPRLLGKQIQSDGFVTIEGTPVFFFSELNITVCGVLMENQKLKTKDILPPLTIYTSAEGTRKQKLHEVSLDDLLSRSDVLDFDPRGLGIAGPRNLNGKDDRAAIHGTLFKLNYDSIMLGTSLMAQQVFDIVRAYEFAVQHGYRDIRFAGHGYGGVLALLAAAVTGCKAELENLPPSFTEMATAQIYHYYPLNEVFNLLNHFDIPELITALGDKVIVRNYENPGEGLL